jgi:streptogramin lyase
VAAYSYQNPNAIGNTSANINDYTLSFDVEVNSANSSMSLAVNTFTGPGLRYRTGEVGFPGGLQITSANVFEHFEFNLGSFVPTHLNFDPRGSIWMISFTGNYTGFAVPSVGNQILFSNFEVTMAPEPSLLALFGLSTAGVLILFRNRQ